MTRHQRLQAVSSAVLLVLAAAIVVAAALPAPAAFIAAGSTGLVLVATAMVILEARHRAAVLRDELGSARDLNRRLLKRLEALQGVPADLEQTRLALVELERRVDDLRAIERDRSAALGWQAVAAHVALEPTFVESGADPWAALAVRGLFESLPPGSTALVAGHGPSAVLCALLAPLSTTVVLVTDDPGVADAARAEADRRGLERLETQVAPLVHGRAGEVEGHAYDADALAGLEGAAVLLVAGPPWTLGPGIRHRVLAALTPCLTDDAWIVAADPHHPATGAMRAAWHTTLKPHRRLERIDERLFRLRTGSAPDAR